MKKPVRKKRIIKKRPAAKKAKKAGKKMRVSKTPKKPVKGPKPCGWVTHYYNGIGVAIIKFSKPVRVGTKVRVLGATTDFKAKIGSMQYDHKDIPKAVKGKQIGVKLGKRVREGDEIFEIV